MTAADFRSFALTLPGVVEGAHCGHPDFRLGGRVVASLDSPDVGWAMVKLTPAQQSEVLRASASGFRPANGAWGAQGYTILFLADAKAEPVRAALALAAANVTAKKKPRSPKRC